MNNTINAYATSPLFGVLLILLCIKCNLVVKVGILYVYICVYNVIIREAFLRSIEALLTHGVFSGCGGTKAGAPHFHHLSKQERMV